VTGHRVPVGHPTSGSVVGQCPAPSGTEDRAVPGGSGTPGSGTARPGGAGQSGSVVGRAGVRVRVVGDLYHGRVPDGAVYVGRAAPGLPASRWANRHRVGWCRVCRAEHDQAGAVAAFERELAGRPELVIAARRDLAGVDLACWCRVGAGPCHGDVLVRVAAGGEPGGADAAAAARDLRLW